MLLWFFMLLDDLFLCWCIWTIQHLSLGKVPFFFFFFFNLSLRIIQTVHPKGDQSWVFFGRTDAKAETPVLWPPDAKSWFIGKDPDAGKDWGQEEKVMTEDKMAGWHHRLEGRWVWVNSGSWWWTGRPGMLRFMKSQRVGHDWAPELNWTDTVLITVVS